MRDFSAISQLPQCPAVYALYSGNRPSFQVVYVGIASKLRARIKQHLLLRDSSVTTGASAVSLNPDFVSAIRWWEHPDFADKARRNAAELVAFDLLNPVLRSRGSVTEAAQHHVNDGDFHRQMRSIFNDVPSGEKSFPNLQDAMKRIEDIEIRLAAVENRIGKK
jgi:hypothetical protein